MLDIILTVSFLSAFFSAAVRLAVPLIYAGLGEIIAEKAGILNIGMEGVMLSGAFFSFAGAWLSGSLFVGLIWRDAWADWQSVCFTRCFRSAWQRISPSADWP